MSGKAILLIPAYKPSRDLPALVERIQHLDHSNSIGTVLVMNDGSGPEFDPIFQALSAIPNVVVIRHAINLGKGAALKTGFNYALVTWPDIVGIVTADADGQHAPEDVVRVAQMLLESPRDLILGVRQFREIPLRSLVGNRVSRVVFRIFTGSRLSDTQTGLRGWPKPYCLEVLKIALNGYDFELESLIRKDSGRQIREIPIQTIYLRGNQSSHFNPIRDSMRISFVLLRYCGSSLLAACVDYLVFMMVLSSTQSIEKSQIAGRAAAAMVAFIVARNLVFRSQASWVASLSKYLLLVATMGVVSYSMIQFLHTQAGIGVTVAKPLAEGLLFFGNFAIQRDFIFSKRAS